LLLISLVSMQTIVHPSFASKIRIASPAASPRAEERASIELVHFSEHSLGNEMERAKNRLKE